MPVTHSFSSTLTRSLLSFRREPQPAPDPPPPSPLELHAGSFQTQVTALLHSLSSDDLLSLQWLHLLLDSFLTSHHLFHTTILLRSPDSRLSSDFLDVSVKALDVLNAVLDSLDLLRHRHRPLSIALDALRTSSLSDPHLRRARKALADVSLASLSDDRHTAFTRRNRSFCRSTARHSRPGHSRSLSWSVPKAWSANKHLQAIAASLVPQQDAASSAVFCMSWVLLFVLWALVAAVGCQEKSPQGLPPLPKAFTWAAPIAALHDRIMETARRSKGCSGLLKEVQQTDRYARRMAELTEIPPEGEKTAEVREEVEEMTLVCEALIKGFYPLERKIREVFRSIVRSRSESLDLMGLPQSS